MTIQVTLIDENDAGPELAPLYGAIKSSLGIDFVPDMFRLLSTRPDLLGAILGGYQAVFLGGSVDRRTKEVVAAWTSGLNQCPYCVGTHNYFARAFGGSPELTAAIERGAPVSELPVDEPLRTLLAFVEKVTRTPYKVVEGDWADTIAAGWTRDQVLEVLFTSALFCTITRLVDVTGLGSSVDQSRISELQTDRASG
ncbi:carboxymuconolactone decarboxylase family protein [Phycicoccus sp. CSK15P-2]|uniref:carboxymuconolactone decarboxylase family protein n=1 Tax=Phycicoccus sp. CSK15P-2 TaxID=2807627 RepID=UPI00194E1762|nr:carboxymuconolactone decarboxylase family protein [Phycicoccus sp. CSK15P-2]MBM6405596.1 carboxymuconolactone decarboxylase family protein [Phycicoccus sp. CSK15P-2]